jgi:hypothetical protein
VPADQRTVIAVLIALVALVAVAGAALAARRRGRAQALLDETQRARTQRARVLHTMQQWLAHEPAAGQTQVPR